MPQQLSQYNDYTTAWAIQGFESQQGKEIYLFLKHSHLIIHAHIVSRLRMKGAMTPPQSH